MAEIRPALRLECHHCHWTPPTDMTMQIVQMHFNMDHENGPMTMDLAAVCSCGETMTFVESRPTGGGHKDYFRCEVCDNTGALKRDS